MVGPLSAIHFPWSLGYIRKLVFGSPWGNYFTPGFVCNQHKAPRNIILSDTALSGYPFTPSGASDIHFFCSEKFMSNHCRIRTTDLSIYSRTRYHWTNAPALYKLIYILFLPLRGVSFLRSLS